MAKDILDNCDPIPVVEDKSLTASPVSIDTLNLCDAEFKVIISDNAF